MQSATIVDPGFGFYRNFLDAAAKEREKEREREREREIIFYETLSRVTARNARLIAAVVAVIVVIVVVDAAARVIPREVDFLRVFAAFSRLNQRSHK